MEQEERPVPDGPQISAETWFALAIAAFVLTVCAFVIAAAWVFSSPEAVLQQRAQAFTPFGGALVAVVTFFTIAWRGVLNTKQLEYQAAQIAHQAEQLAQTRRQNDAKDEENLAKLLMDGTKLLGEDKESHVLAGVAALQAVVVSPKDTFASHAMDILVDVVARTFKQPSDQIFAATRRAINNGAAAGRSSTRALKLDYGGVDENYAYVVNGLRRLAILNAQLDSHEYGRLLDKKSAFFENCEVEECEVADNHRNFKKCTFVGCRIKTMTATFLANNVFDSCDFTGSVFSGPSSMRRKDGVHPFSHLKGRGNSYEAESPPRGGRRVDWDTFIDRIDPIPDEMFEDIPADDEQGSSQT